MSESHPSDDSSIQERLSQILSAECPILTPRLKNLFQKWSADIEKEILESDSALAFFTAIVELSERLTAIDPQDPSAQQQLIDMGRSLDKIFEEKIALSAPTVRKIFRTRPRRGAAPATMSRQEYSPESVREHAYEIRTLVRHVESLGKKNVDIFRVLWQRGGVNMEKGDKDVHERDSAFQEAGIEELFAVLSNPESNPTEDQEAIVLSDLPGGRIGPDTSKRLYQRWVASADSVLGDWLAGRLDNTDAMIVATRFQRLGYGSGEALEWNSSRGGAHGEEWTDLYKKFQESYGRLFDLFGAISLIRHDEEQGETVSVEQRSEYMKRSSAGNGNPPLTRENAPTHDPS